MANLLSHDLDRILDQTRDLWEELHGQRIFLTGGTGFFGCWLLESFLWANDRLKLGANAMILTRDAKAFKHKAPHLASHPSIRFHTGDVRTFEFPEGSFEYIIHAASSAGVKMSSEDPLMVFETIVGGTWRVLEFARWCSTKKLLLTSSGAVYGQQPPAISHITEEYLGAPDPVETSSAYAEGKRAAELFCALFSRQYGIETKIARGFAFVGPYLPLEDRNEVSNFIRDGLRGGAIEVKGDGTSSLSYMYAADLAIWLWKILFRGAVCRPYNVGSEDAVTIREVADCVAANFQPSPEVRIAKAPMPASPPDRYVPQTRRAREELGLQTWTHLPEAVRRTVRWHLGI